MILLNMVDKNKTQNDTGRNLGNLDTMSLISGHVNGPVLQANLTQV
jgi:hypothetical protein